MSYSLTPQVIQAFAKRLHLSHLDSDLQKILAEKIGLRLIEHFIHSISQELTEEQKNTSLVYIEKKDFEGFAQYLAQHVPNFYNRLGGVLPKG